MTSEDKAVGIADSYNNNSSKESTTEVNNRGQGGVRSGIIKEKFGNSNLEGEVGKFEP